MEVGDRIILTAPSWAEPPHTFAGSVLGPHTSGKGWWNVNIDGMGRVICHEAALQVVS